MDENEIKIGRPATDTKSVNGILCLLDNCGFLIPGLPAILTPKFMASQIQNGEILTIENSGTVIGAATVYKIEEPNEFGLFTLIFDQRTISEPETMAAAVRLFREYYQKRGLTKITVLLPNTDEITGKILIANEFKEELPLQSQLKVPGGFQDLRRLTTTANGREIKPLSISASVLEKNQKIEKLGIVIKELQEQLAVAKKINQEITANLSPESSELQEKIISLQKEVSNANKEKEKYKEWLDGKNDQFKIAEEKIRLLETGSKEPEKTLAVPHNKSELGKNEEIILKLVIDHPDGIKQQQIIKETGIVQSEVSKCVRSLAKIGLVINQKVGIERLVKPVLEETERPEAKPESELETNQKVESALKKLLNPEISLVKGLSLKELGIEPEKAEKFVEAVKATGHCHIIGSAKDPENCFIRLKKIDLSRNKGGAEKTEPDPLRPKETQTAVIPIEELLEGEKERLNACFSTPSKFIKAKGEILEALKSGKPIVAELFGSHHSIKKSELPAVIMLLCKEINDDNKEKGKPLVKEIKIKEAPDYANTTVEIIAAIGISEQKITEDKEEAKKPVTIKPEKVEEVDEEPALKASEKILAKLSQTYREIFYAIEKAGGSLTKTALKNEVGISKEVLELCISTLAENGLVTSDLENVSLNNMT